MERFKLDIALDAETANRTEDPMTDPDTSPVSPASTVCVRPTRPTLDDIAVRTAAVRALWTRVRDWLVDGGTPESEVDDESDRVVREIADALEYGETGYHVCRSLDRAGWSPDDGLVEIMGDVLHARHDVLRVAEVEWVAANGIRPAHAVGDVVSIAKYPGRFDRSRVDGEVIEIDHARGQYLVFSAALGHVRKEDAKNHARGSLGRLVAFEDVLPSLASASASAPAPEAAQETTP